MEPPWPPTGLVFLCGPMTCPLCSQGRNFYSMFGCAWGVFWEWDWEEGSNPVP